LGKFWRIGDSVFGFVYLLIESNHIAKTAASVHCKRLIYEYLCECDYKEQCPANY